MKILRSDGKELSCVDKKHATKKIEADIYLQNTIMDSEKRFTRNDYKIIK